MLSSGLFCPYIFNNTSRSVYPKPNDYFFSKKFRFIEQQEKGQIVFELFAKGFQRLRDVILNGLLADDHLLGDLTIFLALHAAFQENKMRLLRQPLQGLPNKLLKLLGEELLRITVLQGADAEDQLSFRRLEELLLHRDPNLLVAQVIQGKVLDQG